MECHLGSKHSREGGCALALDCATDADTGFRGCKNGRRCAPLLKAGLKGQAFFDKSWAANSQALEALGRLTIVSSTGLPRPIDVQRLKVYSFIIWRSAQADKLFHGARMPTMHLGGRRTFP
jgi:hypothetical protein